VAQENVAPKPQLGPQSKRNPMGDLHDDDHDGGQNKVLCAGAFRCRGEQPPVDRKSIPKDGLRAPASTAIKHQKRILSREEFIGEMSRQESQSRLLGVLRSRTVEEPFQ